MNNYGIYFKKTTDVKRFCEFYRWAKAVNRKNKMLDKESLNYALFEILAEHKRKGMSKLDLIKAMLSFGILFLAKELPARKKRAKRDGISCIEAARKIGYRHTAGSLEFPIFSKLEI